MLLLRAMSDVLLAACRGAFYVVVEAIFFVHEMNEGCLREAGSWHCVWLRVVLQTP